MRFASCERLALQMLVYHVFEQQQVGDIESPTGPEGHTDVRQSVPDMSKWKEPRAPHDVM